MSRVLLDVLAKPGFIQVIEAQEEPRNHDSLGSPDLTVSLLVDGRPWTLLVEMKAAGEPRLVRSGLAQLDRYIRSLPEQSYGVLMAPYISEESAALCIQNGFGYVDLSGNASLRFGSVYIETRTTQRSPLQMKRGPRPLFSPKSERVLRTLLTPPIRPWKVVELSEVTKVSLGQISSVRQRLIEHEWAEASEDGLILVSPQSLAAAWKGQYKRRLVREVSGYSLLNGAALEEAVRSAQQEGEGGAEILLASFSAAKWIAPYARQGGSFFYATDNGCRTLSERLQLESAAKGSNLTIWIPQEDDVFTGRIEPAPGVWSTGLIQTWLDLGLAGERGREAAEHLFAQVITPQWEASLG